nr:hypothetical protein [Kallotenue papyrolyticum]
MFPPTMERSCAASSRWQPRLRVLRAGKRPWDGFWIAAVAGSATVVAFAVFSGGALHAADLALLGAVVAAPVARGALCQTSIPTSPCTPYSSVGSNALLGGVVFHDRCTRTLIRGAIRLRLLPTLNSAATPTLLTTLPLPCRASGI